LRREKTAKPVLRADDLILLLTHHWARDTSIFPTEDQRLALATIMLLLIYTGCRPAELVYAAKGKIATDRDQIYEDDNWDNECESLDETKDDDPIYESPEPCVNPKNPDYDNEDHENVLIREYKALCYEDIRL
jgi:integrase